MSMNADMVIAVFSSAVKVNPVIVSAAIGSIVTGIIIKVRKRPCDISRTKKRRKRIRRRSK